MPRSQATVNTRFTATNQMRGTLRQMGQQVRRFARIGVTAAAGAGAAMLAATQRIAQTGDEAGKMARELGLGAEALQELRFASDRQGVSTEDLEKALGSLNNRVGLLRQGQGSLATVLRQSNPALMDQLTAAEDTEQAFNIMVQAMNDTENAADRAALAQAAFGRSGQSLVRVAEAGTDGIAALRQEARDLGLVMSEEATVQSEKFVDATTNLKAAAQGALQTALIPMIPKITELAQAMSQWIAQNRGLMAQRLDEVLGRIADAGRLIARLWNSGVIPAILAGVAVYKALTGAIKVYQTAATVAKGVQIAFNAVLAANPIGLVVVAISALVAGLVLAYNKSEKFREFINGLWESLKAFGAWLSETFGPIISGIGGALGSVGKFVGGIAQGVGNFLGGGEDSGGGQILTRGAADAQRQAQFNQSRLDVNFNNMPAGTTTRQSGRSGPNIRVNFAGEGASP